jgi:hypothetical protein
MLEKIGLLESHTMRGLLVALVAFLGVAASLLFHVDEKLFNQDGAKLIDAFMTLFTLASLVYAGHARATRASPPLTNAAVEANQDLAKRQAGDKQQGFARLALLFVLGITGLSLTACVGTQAAYKAAKTLPDEAYVIAEHYSIVVKEAADLAQNPGTPAEVRDALKKADAAVKPFVVGDPVSHSPGLRDLANAYRATESAQTQSQLQEAVNQAVTALSNFINAVKAARSR